MDEPRERVSVPVGLTSSKASNYIDATINVIASATRALVRALVDQRSARKVFGVERGERRAQSVGEARPTDHRRTSAAARRTRADPSPLRRGTTCACRWATLWLTTLFIATNVPGTSRRHRHDRSRSVGHAAEERARPRSAGSSVSWTTCPAGTTSVWPRNSGAGRGRRRPHRRPRRRRPAIVPRDDVAEHAGSGSSRPSPATLGPGRARVRPACDRPSPTGRVDVGYNWRALKSRQQSVSTRAHTRCL